MKYDVILAGVGGQGVLSVATAIALGAMKEGLQVRQSEVHGMAQRGGAVQAHLRLADGPIYGDLVGRASAHLILSMEPLEALRYLAYLRPDGVVVSAAEPVRNIGNYPEIERVYGELRRLPQHRLVEAAELAREAGSLRATNMVMVGAASGFLPLQEASLLAAIEERFAGKGESVVAVNRAAFALGRRAVEKG
ncbi:MAG: indolepyruvate oxidoreductase subunit beta [Spirochaetales bacterium]|nr:indolepyruvate oxidoreductase subunit beta [Spirochaetales bacterium]